MTVLDEVKNRSRYNRLVYVEFLEMLCRVALHVGKLGPDRPVEIKLYELLKVIFERRYESGKDQRETFPLKDLKADDSESEEY